MSSLNSRMDASKSAPIVAVWREPFSLAAPTVEFWKQGMTVYEIVHSWKNLPEDFAERGSVMINGTEINRGAWHLVKPKGSTGIIPVAVTFHMPLRGGKKGGSGKAIIGIVALLALTLLTAGIASAGLGTGALAGAGEGIGGFFVAGSTSAKILAGAVGLIGALAISALTKPPSSKQKDADNTESPEAASADGNVIEPNGGVPRVIGTRKVFPPLACEAFTDLVGQDEFVEAAVILNGPHAISNIQAGSSTIADDTSIQTEIREGWPSDTLVSIVDRYSRSVNPNLELSAHKLNATNGQELENAAEPLKNLPQWHRFSTRKSPDEAYIYFILPGGLNYPADPVTYPVNVPVRIRIRKSGDIAWINLPEIHFRGRSSRQAKYQVILKWDAPLIPAASGVTMPLGDGVAFIYHRMAIQTTAPADTGTYQWEADASFYSGAGNTYMINGAATGMQNIYVDQNDRTSDGKSWNPGGASAAVAQKNTVHVFLNSGTFPKGIYEIEVMRGAAYVNGSFTPASYSYGSVYNFFKYANLISDRIIITQTGIVSNLAVARIASVWNEHPLPLPGFATIALRAKNKRLENISCIASGYVKDWDGSGWNTWTTTSNPAPHFRDVLAGRLNLDPVPESMIDDDALVDWRTHCTAQDYTCDMIADNLRLEEVLSLIASCGYAQPYWSEVWGIIKDYDRSAESPVQVFSPRNSRGFKYRKAFARLPDGLLISYKDDAEDYRQQQVSVYRGGIPASDTSRMEQVTYEGMVDVAKITGRGEFDLAQGELRTTFYSLEAPVEAIVCRRGSLVAVQHDIITSHAAAGRIVKAEVSGGNVVSIRIDAEVDFTSSADFASIADITAVEDVLDIGVTMGCAIRRTDGTITTHALSNTTDISDILTFTMPFADSTTAGGPFDAATIKQVTEGCLVVIGPLGSEYLRLIVSEIIPGADMTAKLTFVDEAPELWA